MSFLGDLVTLSTMFMLTELLRKVNFSLTSFNKLHLSSNMHLINELKFSFSNDASLRSIGSPLHYIETYSIESTNLLCLANIII